jgi:hypothetical protein
MVPLLSTAALLALITMPPEASYAASGGNRLRQSPITHSGSMTMQYNEFWQQDAKNDFENWEFHSIAVSEHGQQVDVYLQPNSSVIQAKAPKHSEVVSPHYIILPGNEQTCSATDIDGGVSHYDSSAGLCAGKDPHPRGSYKNNLNYYNGDSFYYGTLISPIHQTQKTITTLIASWNASTPAGTWLETHVRILQDKTWSHWYALPIWASDFSAVQRHSVDGQNDTTGRVDTDTFSTKGIPASAYQLSITLFSTNPAASPHLRRVSVIATNDSDAPHTPTVTSTKEAWGINLDVPQRSQMLPEYHGKKYGGGGEVWCSPTSTSMVMAYWSRILNRPELTQSVPDAARDTYDFIYDGTGNWPFNTAYAGHYGLRAFVTRMYSMSQVEQWIKAGVPVIMSTGYGTKELPGSPIPSSNGHILVIRGFTAQGDVITNDPAARSNEAVQIVYPRTILQKLWLNTSNGTVYIIYPEQWQTPTRQRFGAWE